MKSAYFFVFVLNYTKRRCSDIKQKLKVEKEDGRKVNFQLKYFNSKARLERLDNH